MSPDLSLNPIQGGYGIPQGRVASTRFSPSHSGSPITPPPLGGSQPSRTGASGFRLQGAGPSTQPCTVQPLHQSEEHPLPWVPRQQPIDEPTGCPDDLARQL